MLNLRHQARSCPPRAALLIVKWVNLLVVAADDRSRVPAEPLLQNRGVDPAEVDRRPQVFAVQPLSRVERRVFGVEPAFDLLADQESAGAGAMIGSTSVVSDPATKFGEDEHHDFVGGAVLREIVEERLDCRRQLTKQL